jgi:hypothetical protein
VLTPRLSDIESYHGNDVEVVDEDEDDVGLQPSLESPVGIVVGLGVIHTGHRPVVITVIGLEDGNDRDLPTQLNAENDDHLRQIGNSEKRASGSVNAQLLCCPRVANKDDEEEVEA